MKTAQQFNPKNVAKPRKRLPSLCRPRGDQDGPVYVSVAKGKATIAKCVELWPGIVIADVDKQGRLIGVEVIR